LFIHLKVINMNGNRQSQGCEAGNVIKRIYEETLNALARKLGADRDVIDYIKNRVEIRLLPYSGFPEKVRKLESEGIEEYASRLAAYGLNLAPREVERLGYNCEVLDFLSPQQKKRIAEMLKRAELYERLEWRIAERENRISALTEEMKAFHRMMRNERSRLEGLEGELEILNNYYDMLREAEEREITHHPLPQNLPQPIIRSKGKEYDEGLARRKSRISERLKELSEKMREKEREIEALKQEIKNYVPHLKSLAAEIRNLRRERRRLLSEMQELKRDYELLELIKEYARKLRIQKEFLYYCSDDWNAHPDFDSNTLRISERCTERRRILIDTLAAELGHFIGFLTYLKHHQHGFNCNEKERKRIHDAVHELFDTVARRAMKKDNGAIEMRYLVYELWKELKPTKDTTLEEIKQRLNKGGKRFGRGRRMLLKFVEELERNGYSTLDDVSNASPEERYRFLGINKSAWTCIEDLADEEMDDPHLKAAELYFSLKKKDRRFERKLLRKLGELPERAFAAPELFAECWEKLAR